MLTRYSRLLIDPNRGRRRPDAHHAPLRRRRHPGNRRLDAAERERRIRLYYQPYHRAIDAVIDQCLATGVTPVLLSIHTFTESWKERSRPWHVGVLWDRDQRLAGPLLDALLRRGRPHRRRQRALLGPARGRLPVAARHAARPRQRADRGPPGPDPRRGRPGGLGGAARRIVAEDPARYMGRDARRPSAGTPHARRSARSPRDDNGAGDMTKIDKSS